MFCLGAPDDGRRQRRIGRAVCALRRRPCVRCRRALIGQRRRRGRHPRGPVRFRLVATEPPRTRDRGSRSAVAVGYPGYPPRQCQVIRSRAAKVGRRLSAEGALERRFYGGRHQYLEGACRPRADPDLEALDGGGERRRRRVQRATVTDWHRRGLLRTDLSPAPVRHRVDDDITAPLSTARCLAGLEPCTLS